MKESNAEFLTRHNLSRYVIENRPVAWLAVVLTTLWGVWAYTSMPKRKDPYLPPRQVAIVAPWPGQTAERVEQLVTRKIEQRLALNQNVVEIKSTTRSGLAVVYAELDELVPDISKDLDDLKIKLDGLTDLPQGAGPVQYIKDFGDTSALMLTVASPLVDKADVSGMAGRLSRRVNPRQTMIGLCAAQVIDASHLAEAADQLRRQMREMTGTAETVLSPECAALLIDKPGQGLAEAVQAAWNELPQRADLHPDIWDPVVVNPGESLEQKLMAARGTKYSYRDLDDFTDRLEKEIKTAAEVSRVTRVGVLEEQIELRYSQQRLASLGIAPGTLPQLIQARNVVLPAGGLVSGGRNIEYRPTSEFATTEDITNSTIAQSQLGTPVYLREIGQVRRGYAHPATVLNSIAYHDSNGQWTRGRAVTLSVEMKKTGQIDSFAESVAQRISAARKSLPADLVILRSADQQRQVREKLDLFNRSLWEAIVLVVVVSFIGFWEWRSALLMALSIPTTIAMTFGLMHLLGLDLQQMSIASLIIALGLLVDDPVVAGDAIKRELTSQPRSIAAWLGPTKLSKAILYATVTNIAAYLPFLLLTGDVGRYVYSLPVTIGCSLVASRVVSMAFIPLFAYYLLRPTGEIPVEQAREWGFGKWYARLITKLIRYRWATLAISSSLLAGGAFFKTQLHDQFFPRENFYIAYVDVVLPEDAPITTTRQRVYEAEQVIRDVSDRASREAKAPLIQSITEFVGASSPRFWFSVTPEPPSANYAQLLVQFRESEDTNRYVGELQEELSRRVSGARMDVRVVETGPPTLIPISLRIVGDDARQLHGEARKLAAILGRSPLAVNLRDNWGTDVVRGRIQIDQDRAALAGVSGQDLAVSSFSGLRGAPVGVLREGRRNLPMVQILNYTERPDAATLENLYLYSSNGPGNNITLGQIARILYEAEPGVIQRINQHRAITVSALVKAGHVASEVTAPLEKQIRGFEKQLPPGYRLEIAGEWKEQVKGQKQSAVVGLASSLMIFLALVIQFRSPVKPLIVFSSIPFGAAGALGGVWLMGLPMGFLAILGITSLIGVIVSHVIVLFDFIEERHEAGANFHDAIIDAGIQRIRPVLVTVGATLAALFPLAEHGGPLFEALCWAQIGGLTIATVLTLVLVPVIYAVFVDDLKIVRWDRSPSEG